MRGTIPRLRGVTAKVAIVVLMALLVSVPVVSGYLNKNIDMTEYVREQSCYCHGTEVEPDVTIIIDVPERTSYTPTNRSIDVMVGILGEPENLTGFGLYLNTSETDDNVRWKNSYINDSGMAPIPEDLIKVNGTSLWSVGPITDNWFNVSFIPGNTDQEIVVSVVGMRANDNINESGDFWNIGSQVVEVREQRLATLNVTVTNEQSIAVSEVLVDFYVDDEYIGNNTIQHIPENGKENASVQWDITYVKDGKHDMRAVIDPNGRITVLDRDNLEINEEIWLGEKPEELDNTLYYGLGAVLVGVFLIFMVFWFWRRRQYQF